MRCLPSDLYGLTDPLQRFYFNRAIWIFGTNVENDLDEVDNKSTGKKVSQKALASKKQMVLNKWLPPKDGNTRGRFKDPAIGAFGKRNG